MSIPKSRKTNKRLTVYLPVQVTENLEKQAQTVGLKLHNYIKMKLTVISSETKNKKGEI